jgi:hypothetical protein
LGVFGFLSLEDESLGIPGNAGFKDQTFALKWVKSNIQNFGGDPANITIFGESNGGGCVHYHTISEHSKGLFNRVIATSGSAFCKTWTCYPRRNWNERIAKSVGWDGTGGEKGLLKFLEKINPFDIVAATDQILTDEEKFQYQMLFAIGPTIEPYETENCFIPKDPVLMARDAWGNDIDMMIGGNSNEGIMIIFYVNTYHDPLINFYTRFYNNLPIELKIEPGSDKAIKYGKSLKKLYLGCTEPSDNNLQGYLHVKIYNVLVEIVNFFFSFQRTFIFGMECRELFYRVQILEAKENHIFLDLTLKLRSVSNSWIKNWLDFLEHLTAMIFNFTSKLYLMMEWLLNPKSLSLFGRWYFE